MSAPALVEPAAVTLPSDLAAAPSLANAPGSGGADYQPSTVPGMIRIDDKAYIMLAARWPAHATSSVTTIPVCWEEGAPGGPERDWVKDAVTQSWQAHSNSRLRFIGFGNCAVNSVGIRIAVRDDGAQNAPHTKGLGKNLNGVPEGMVLNFTFGTWSKACAEDLATREACIRSIAVHEFGHALGFAHEQNRPDTPGECATLRQGPNGDALLTPYDAESVMNYCNPAYNNDGQLSQYDVAGLLAAYGH